LQTPEPLPFFASNNTQIKVRGERIMQSSGNPASGNPASETLVSLAALERRRRAVVRAVGRAADGTTNGIIERRLLEIGFEEGRETEVRHVSPIGDDPIAVRIDQLSIAIRRSEAAFVLVEVLAPSASSGGSVAPDGTTGPAR
jgi:ferrous iron transport protein A